MGVRLGELPRSAEAFIGWGFGETQGQQVTGGKLVRALPVHLLENSFGGWEIFDVVRDQPARPFAWMLLGSSRVTVSASVLACRGSPYLKSQEAYARCAFGSSRAALTA